MQYSSVLYAMSIMWRPLVWKQDGWPPFFLICFMKILGPKNNYSKFKKNLYVEIYSKALPTSCNIEEFCMNCW